MTKQERKNKIIKTVKNNGVELLSTRSLAETFNVSEITIRRDLQELSDEGLIHRQHGGVTLPKVAINNIKHVGILLVSRLGKFSHPFFNEVLEGADVKLQCLGYHPAFVKTFIEVDSDESVKDLLDQYPVEGLLVIGELNRERFERWRKYIPHIVTTPTKLSKHSDTVLFDGHDGMHQLMAHLSNLNNKRIGFIVSRSVLGQTDLRLEAFLEGVKTYHFDDNPELVFEMSHELELVPDKIGQQGAEKLMNLSKTPDVIMCSSDMIALGAIQWLQKKGYRVPEDVAVTGFDDLPEAVRTFPPLTTVHVHKKLMGALAAELLQRRIEHPSDPALKVITPTSLKVRQSCGAERLIKD